MINGKNHKHWQHESEVSPHDSTINAGDSTGFEIVIRKHKA
jgi:hypothetical protein